MALPSGYTMVRVFDTYLDLSGHPLGGSVSFTPTAVVTDGLGNVVFPMEPVTVTVNQATGTFSVPLPCTDNEALSPDGWAYTVGISIPGLSSEPFNVLLPSALGASAELRSVTPGGGTPPEVDTYVSSVNGQVGAVVMDAADFGALTAADNLSDLPSASAARTHLGLGAAALLGTPVPLASGGTGASSQQAAVNALTGTQGAGKYLRSDGTDAALAVIQAADLPAATTSAQGAVQFDGTGSDVQALAASAAAGTSGRAADAKHVHPYTGLALVTQLPPAQFPLKAYGAYLDGATDDTPAWTAAVAAATAAGGGVVTFAGNTLINGSGGVGVTIPANVSVQGGMTSMQLSTATPGWTNIIIGSNSLSALFNVTGNSVAIGGFTVTAANTGCTVPVIMSASSRQYYANIYANNTGGYYLDGVSRSNIYNVNLSNANTGYGFYMPNSVLVYLNNGNAGPNGSATYGALSGVTTTAGLTSGSTYTSVAVTSLNAALSAGQLILIGSLTGNIQPAVVSANASSGATSVSVTSFKAQYTINSGASVIQASAGYVIGGSTVKVQNYNASAGWGYPKFISNLGTSFFEDTETNESSQNGVDALYCNNVASTTFLGIDNTTGSFTGYMFNLVNSCERVHFLGGLAGGGNTGIINIDGTSGSGAWDITFGGIDFRVNGLTQSSYGINLTGSVQRFAFCGNTWYQASNTNAILNDASTVSNRAVAVTGNAFSGLPASLTVPVILSSFTPGSVVIAGNTGIPGMASRTVQTVAVSSNTYTPLVSSGGSTIARIQSPSANFTIENPSGTPLDGDSLTITVRSGGTAYTPTWGTAYEGSTGLALPATLTPSAVDNFGFQYNSVSGAWLLLAYMPGFT